MRIKENYQYNRPKPGYYQGLGDVISILYIVFHEYYTGEVTTDSIEHEDPEVRRIIESAIYTLCIYIMDNISQGSEKFHPEVIWERIKNRITKKEMNFFKKYDELNIKQQFYKIMVCFFARDLKCKLAVPIYDNFICGINGGISECIEKYVNYLIHLMINDGYDPNNIYKVMEWYKKFIPTLNPVKISVLLKESNNF